MAVAWGLEHTRYFTLGCNDLVVVTDHKPLVNILNDTTLDELTCNRLFRLKLRTLLWNFTIKYLPGKTNEAADATSRYPNFKERVEDVEEDRFIGAIMGEVDTRMAIPWSLVVSETNKDLQLSELIKAIRQDFSNVYDNIESYLRYKDSFYISEGVVFYKDRVVIPSTLRKKVVETLHSAHQGVASMEMRARALVFWPGMSYDIKRIREECFSCNQNAPTQAPMPAEPPSIPSAPFQQIFADFFDFAGRHYLVVGDRLSGWSEIYATPSGTQYAGARGLIHCFRFFFGRSEYQRKYLAMAVRNSLLMRLNSSFHDGM